MLFPLPSNPRHVNDRYHTMPYRSLTLLFPPALLTEDTPMRDCDVTPTSPSHSSLGLLIELFSNLEKSTLSQILRKHNDDVLATIEECLDFSDSRDYSSPEFSSPTIEECIDFPDRDFSSTETRNYSANQTSPAPPPTFIKDTTMPKTSSPQIKTEPSEAPAPEAMNTTESAPISTPSNNDFSISNLITKTPRVTTEAQRIASSESGGGPIMTRLMWPFSDAALLRTLVTCNSCNSIIQLGDKFCRVCGMPALPFIL